MTIIYRDAEINDTNSCVRILRDWFNEASWMPTLPYTEQSMEIFWREVIEDDFAWVALSKNDIVGFCTYDDEQKNVGALYVLPRFRNSGIGRRLINLVKENSEEIIAWSFEVNERARQFYLREGFIEVGREFDEETNLIDVKHHWVKETFTMRKLKL